MNSKRIWTLIGALVAGAVLVLGWFVGLSPLLSQAATADAEREEVEQVNATELAKLEQMKAQYSKIGSLRVSLANLRVSLPAEADTDFVYGLLGGIQGSTGANVATITTGEAVPYGAADASATAESASGAVSSVPSLYTVPLTVTFDSVETAKVLAFADAMQSSPRLFLVTGVTGDGAGSSTITAYMFVLYDENAPRGAAAQAYAGSVPGVTKSKPAAVPEPQVTESPAPEDDEEGEGEDPTPTPTPTP